MTIIQKIRAEIERLYDGEAPAHDQQCEFEDGYFMGIDKISNFIDTLESERPVPKDLEEAAEKYTQEMLESWKFDSTGCRPPRESFIAGAKWQKQHDAELIEIAYNDGITIGMTKQKEQMLKEAVEADVNIYRDLAEGESWAEFVVAKPPKNLGDKVRIIVCKKEDEK